MASPLPFQARVARLGTIALVLGVIQLGQGLTMLANLVSPPTTPSWTKDMLTRDAPDPEAARRVVEAADRLNATLARIEPLRALPFCLASAFLIAIAIRLRRGDPAALRSARSWVGAAFAVLAFSVLVQVQKTLPPTMEYLREYVAVTPQPDPSLRPMMESMIGFGAVAGVVLRTAIMAVWPILLFVWSGRLLREAEAEGHDRRPAIE